MRLLILLFAVASLLILTGCESATDPQSGPAEPGTISGMVRLDPDVRGTVDGTVVELYASPEDAMMMRPARTVVADQEGRFEFRDVYPGTHYLGLWKDNDGNGMLSSGDFSIDRSSQACCCQVNSGCTTQMCPFILVVP